MKIIISITICGQQSAQQDARGMGRVGGVTGQMLRHVTTATGFIVIIKKETSDMSRVKRTTRVDCCVAVCVYVCVCV